MPRDVARSEFDRQSSCPICSSRGNWSFDSRFVAVHRCADQRCAHLYAVGVDSDHGVMHEVDAEVEESLYAERNERLVAFWEGRRFATAESKLLDVGAGTGHLAQCLKSRLPGSSVHCVEQSAKLRSRLEEQGFVVSDRLDSIALDFSFDAVLLVEVIEHVPDPVDFLKRLRGLLDPNGRIFLTTPCGELRNGSRATNAYDAPEHVQFFSERSLRLAVTRAGYRNITYEYVDALYPRCASALSLANIRRLAKNAVRPILTAYQGSRHLTGFIDP